MLNSIPLRFVANTSSQALSLISSNFTGGKMPAFAQRMSTPPNSAATVAMTSSISPCSLTSPRQNITVLPRPRRASTVAAPSGSFRPSKQTRAPSWAKTPAMPLPMPLVPPVTITDLFLIDVSTESSLFIRSASVSEGLFLGSQLTFAMTRARKAPEVFAFDRLLYDASSLRLVDQIREFGLSRGRSSFRKRYHDPNNVECAWNNYRAGEALGGRVANSRVSSKHIRFAAAQQLNRIGRDMCAQRYAYNLRRFQVMT